MKTLLGRKVGMTQIWDDKGRLIAGTVIYAEPNTVVRTDSTVHLVAPSKGKVNKAQTHFAEAIGAKRGISVKQVSALDTEGDKLDVSQFNVGEAISMSGVTKGKGFAGGMKRHGFHGGPAGHGGDNQRGPGSIGAQRPQRVPKGQKMAGHMGARNLTVRGGKVLAVDVEQNILIVSGNVPGANKSKVVITSQS